MKKNISLSFCMLILMTILSLANIIGIIPSFINIFRSFTLLKLCREICSTLCALAPLVLVALLYLNRKQDIRKIMCIALIILGAAQLARLVLNLPSFIIPKNEYDATFPVVKTVWLISNALLTGCILFLSAFSIKKCTTSGLLKILGFVGLWISVFYLLAILAVRDVSLEARFSPIFPDAIVPILMYIGLWALPKTLYDYKNCWFMDAFTMKWLAFSVAVIIFIFMLARGTASNNNSNNDSGGYRCNICGGDGWDSENNCSCIWCGGDGKTSWNP